jgi:hypothetical protein
VITKLNSKFYLNVSFLGDLNHKKKILTELTKRLEGVIFQTMKIYVNQLPEIKENSEKESHLIKIIKIKDLKIY